MCCWKPWSSGNRIWSRKSGRTEGSEGYCFHSLGAAFRFGCAGPLRIAIRLWWTQSGPGLSGRRRLLGGSLRSGRQLFFSVSCASSIAESRHRPGCEGYPVQMRRTMRRRSGRGCKDDWAGPESDRSQGAEGFRHSALLHAYRDGRSGVLPWLRPEQFPEHSPYFLFSLPFHSHRGQFLRCTIHPERRPFFRAESVG